MAFNRKTRREMSRYGLGEEILHKAAEKTILTTRTTTYRLAWGGMMLVLHKKYGFDLKKLDELAVETVRTVRNALTPTDLRDELLELTGFDVDEPIAEDRLGIEE